MRILTYKRTHIGDPNPNGEFGINHCMGRVREYKFDAVIGIGGISSEPISYGINGRINWVGINPKRQLSLCGTGPVITFENFVLLDEKGPILSEIAPNLAKRMYENGARLLLDDYSAIEFAEAKKILEWSKTQKSPNDLMILRNENIGCSLKCKKLK